eukprot:symbB.v1.2.024179.t1/scaffold2268.1/size83883/3
MEMTGQPAAISPRAVAPMAMNAVSVIKADGKREQNQLPCGQLWMKGPFAAITWRATVPMVLSVASRIHVKVTWLSRILEDMDQ